MQALLFPELFAPPAAPSDEDVTRAAPGAGGAGRRGRRTKGRAEAVERAAAVVESLLPAEGSGPVAAAAVEAPVAARRPDAGVLVFDVETTGTDRKRDQVIELCMQRGLSGTDHKVWRFKPTVAIHPRAQ
jgi:hypothetical protein